MSAYEHKPSTVFFICQGVSCFFTNLSPTLTTILQTGGGELFLVNGLCPLLTVDGVASYNNVHMSVQEAPIVSFLKEVMRRRKRLPSQLASDLGVSHATVSRWLKDEDVPSTRSCQRLAAYSGVPVEKVLSIAGHLPRVAEKALADWPEFRDYARQMYPDELDEDLVTMIEDLIERRRRKRYGGENPKMGS